MRRVIGTGGLRRPGRVTFPRFVFPALEIVSLLLLLFLASDGSSAADKSRETTEHGFQVWLTRHIRPEAEARAISRATLDAGLSGVTLDWSLPDLILPGAAEQVPAEQSQAEFGSPGAYFDEARLRGLVVDGRRQLVRWGATLQSIEQRYGVPPAIVVAVWGRESGFGTAQLTRDAIRTLATEAYLGVRKDVFEPELIAALQILNSGAIDRSQLKSSWAGALGQPQLLPTQFLQYAVDFEGTGQRDIWHSVPDSLASIANDLAQQGWQAGREWGFEVGVPEALSCASEGPEQGKPVAAWAKLGIRRLDGKAFPPGEASQTAYLVMPAGRRGPAYLVSPNFYVLKSYNNSDLYALFIGHLADRFAADKPFIGHWAKVGGFNRGDVKAMQDRLVAAGYDVGNADGLIGFKTRIAIGLWQTRKGRPATCFPDAALVREIR
jgi:lytic murein transglycosylase